MRASILKDLRVNAETRYSYREEAPEKVFLPSVGLWRHLPGDLRVAHPPEEGQTAVPSVDLFSGNTPGITLARLAVLCPDLVNLPEGHDPAERVTLPPGWLALHFQLETHRVELPPEEAPDVENPSVEGVEAVDEVPPLVDPPKRGLFASLPIFRRRHVVAIPDEPLKNEGAQTKEDPEEAITIPRGDEFADFEIRIVEAESPALIVPPADRAVPVLETLWKLGPDDRIADQVDLQTLFMTGEQLTLKRVVCLASELPGLKACLLAHGDRVICAPNSAPDVDLQKLSGKAMAMLAHIREASAGMGLGAVPAVTFHGEQGALSFLHKGELCLLVLHAGQGFVPGVRERLQEVLVHLAEARPALR